MGVLEGYGAADATAGAGDEDDLSGLFERGGLARGDGGVDIVVEVVAAGDEAEVVVEVAEGVGEETEPSRKVKGQQTHNLHHNPVVPASLVVA